MLESYIERKVCEYAEQKGWLQYKLGWYKGLPDRIFFKDSRTLMIEFKHKGKKPSVIQMKTIDILKKQNMTVKVIDNIADGKRFIDEQN